MGRPAKEPFLTIRQGNVEVVVQVVASTKQQALDLRPAAEVWADSPANADQVYDSVAPWLQRVATLVRERSEESSRQLPLWTP